MRADVYNLVDYSIEVHSGKDWTVLNLAVFLVLVVMMVVHEARKPCGQRVELFKISFEMNQNIQLLEKTQKSIEKPAYPGVSSMSNVSSSSVNMVYL